MLVQQPGNYNINAIVTFACIAVYCCGMVFNRYDHLARVLTKVLDDRPDNAVDIIENISREAKQTKFTSQVDTVLDKVEPSAEVALAEIQMKLFTVRYLMSFVLSRDLEFTVIESDDIFCPKH